MSSLTRHAEASVRRKVRQREQERRAYWSGPFQSRDPMLAAEMGYVPTVTGVDVSQWTALNFSAVWAAVAIVAADVASLPLVLYKRGKGDSKERYTDSKLYELLHDAPNPEMTTMIFRETLQAHAMTWGNGYAEIERNGAGRPIAFWPLTPDRVSPFRSRGAVFYRVTNANQPEVVIPAADMLHVPGLGFDGLSGYSVIQKARESIGLGLATERFGGTFFGNGSTFGGVLSHPEKLTKEVKQQIRESLDAVHTGVDRAHRFVILGGNMKYEKLGIPPNDAQFLETRRFQVNEIARWFLIPPHKLGDLERATFSNIEQQDIEYYKSGLRRWLVRWEQEINRKAISPLERKQQFVEHNVEGLLRGDSAARADFYSKMFNIGAYSINMILEKENQNGIGPEGDVHFVPMNTVPADIAMEGPPEPKAPPVVETVPPKQLPAADEKNALADLLTELATKTEAMNATLVADREALSESERAQHAADIEAAKAEVQRLQQELAAHTVAADALAHDVLAARAAAAAVEDTLTRTADLATEQGRLAQQYEADMHAMSTQLAEAAKLRFEAELLAEDKRREIEQAQAQIMAAEARIEAETARAATAEQQAETVRAEVAAAERELAAFAAELEAVERARDALREAAEQKDEALRLQRSAEQALVASVMSAHRALIVDAMGRMVRRETEKARRHQATPEKLRAWIEVFYPTHEETCVDALRPAIRAHLAWQQSIEDVETVTLGLVREHIAESVKQLRAVVALVPEEIPQNLERMLMRWEQQRPDRLADRILQKEIDHAVRTAALG